MKKIKKCKFFSLKNYHTLPSISSSIKRFNSPAYSNGNCLITEETNQLTNNDIAFSRDIPLLIK